MRQEQVEISITSPKSHKVRNHVGEHKINVKRPSSKIKQMVDNGMIGDVSRNQSMCQPPLQVQPYTYCHPAPSRKSQDILHKHVRQKEVMPRVVCAESKSPGMRALQPQEIQETSAQCPPTKAKDTCKIKLRDTV